MLPWTERILSFPVRTAAVQEFLRELTMNGWGDLNALLATLNDGDLCRQSLTYWLDKEWIVRAPNSALNALVGPAFTRELTVAEFCGEGEPEEFEPVTSTIFDGMEDDSAKGGEET
ncbi:MAG TPA: hypothetical protein VFF17_13860 [Thermoanaerobaculia bacterium]|nr:hypothetical protein [Thermoanaerobaculia bacterium]